MCNNLEELIQWYLKYTNHYAADDSVAEVTVTRIIDDNVEVKIRYSDGYYSDDCIFGHTEMILTYINHKD